MMSCMKTDLIKETPNRMDEVVGRLFKKKK